MKLNKTQRKIFKLESQMLRNAKWNLTLSLDDCRYNYPDCLVYMAESQLIRWIDELNKSNDVDAAAALIEKKIKNIKTQQRTRETKRLIAQLYKDLDDTVFMPDYICVVMNRLSDYRRANEGFYVNGIKFRRLLGTNGGIKKSTIVYINEDLYPEIKKRIDNGRNRSIPLVPAKLEAYQALICSSSIPVPIPRMIIVKDCITHFKEDVILIDDSEGEEPVLTHVSDYDIERNNSDGCGLMSPEYAQQLNILLNSESSPLSGCNTRYAWEKGMLATFDFVDFAEKVAGTYMIADAWGDLRDVRDADVILTTSMVKLWDCYGSFEDYHQNCVENHYQFSVAKTCPEELEHVRYMNYQFLQPYELTDDEIYELCLSSITEFKDVLGLDWRKSLVFLTGYKVSEESVLRPDYENVIQALMIEPKMINDPYIRKKIWGMLEKKINACKKGSILVNANFAMIFGDLYALAQSMFNLEVTGLLKSGELYHKYWIDKGSNELVCFRAPMTCKNNIRKLKLNKSDDAAYWFQYIKTAAIFNAWDTTCDAMNGCDFDGDTTMCTDNPILIRRTINYPTIMCLQRRAEKSIVTEDQIVEANMIAFNDDIGRITNYVTAMIERQSGFDRDSAEWRELDYRIMCGQKYQQDTIDRAKGIITKPMPEYWYRTKQNQFEEDDSEELHELKKFRQRIVAYRKPYFMTYVYPDLKKEYRKYISDNNDAITRRFACYGAETIDDLREVKPRTPEMENVISYYDRCFPVGMNPCVVNKMARLFENEFDGYLSAKRLQPEFDYSILKSGCEYKSGVFTEVKKIYKEYFSRVQSYHGISKSSNVNTEIYFNDLLKLKDDFSRRCFEVCSNEEELCDILLDICYTSTRYKQFAWDICGDQIVKNLLKRNNYEISRPYEGGNEFDYAGRKFGIKKMIIEENEC